LFRQARRLAVQRRLKQHVGHVWQSTIDCGVRANEQRFMAIQLIDHAEVMASRNRNATWGGARARLLPDVVARD